MLEEMFTLQKGFQKAVDDRCFSDSLEERVQYIKDHAMYMNAEVYEMLYELPFYKSWKDYSGMTDEAKEDAMQKARKEYIDILHFLINIGIALGLDASSTYALFLAKNHENIKRQEEGYTYDKSYR